MVVDKFGRSPKNIIGNINNLDSIHNKVNKSGDIMSGSLLGYDW